MPAGTVPAWTGGSSPAPSQVYRCGSREPSMNAGLDTRSAAGGAGQVVAGEPLAPVAATAGGEHGGGQEQEHRPHGGDTTPARRDRDDCRVSGVAMWNQNSKSSSMRGEVVQRLLVAVDRGVPGGDLIRER